MMSEHLDKLSPSLRRAALTGLVLVGVLASCGQRAASRAKNGATVAPKSALALPVGVRHLPGDARTPSTLLELREDGSWKLSVGLSAGCNLVEVRSPKAPFAELVSSRKGGATEMHFDLPKGRLQGLGHLLVIARYGQTRLAAPQAVVRR